ncbi:integrase [Pseudomonas chlororaphis subsp. aurantiaca]|nr:integrase [Pseudomonas chlororaphis subsp. aurantiaca]
MDITLGWVEREYPQLSVWKDLAVEWVQGETRGIAKRLHALVAFFERYIIKNGLPVDPKIFLARATALPDFYLNACPESLAGVDYNNSIRSFLSFVLLRNFSEYDESGRLVVSPAFHNPIPQMSKSGLPKRDESVYSPLPYGYIDELRQMLVTGPNFRDWHWAQGASGFDACNSRRGESSWFEVTEDLIDLQDPDCVWRERTVRSRTRLEMWSPVRWVALLVKLILPLRTFQVRMLDSGEADTWCYAKGNWELNISHLAQGNERSPVKQGVFHRSGSIVDDGTISTNLYINTNKTADVARTGPQKGYVMPWISGGLVHQDVFYWLEKLRDWQKKYNPIIRRSSWAQLKGRHIRAKSEVQLAGYPDTCFLFRMREADDGDRHLPLNRFSLEPCWFRLIEALELRLERRGETHSNGAPIRLLPPQEKQNQGLTTLFPLHSLRVSLITALALEGQVPFPILQKLVGHSRLLMTLYYTKPGATHFRDVLLDAAERLEANKDISIQQFLLDTDHEELLRKTICNNIPSLAVAVPLHPGARNQAGWMPMHHGLCLVGGNTSVVEENSTVGGCYNGGPLIVPGSTSTTPRHGPVPGGSRNCVRCRWFVTAPHHLPALTAHFNTLAYHFDEARNSCLYQEKILQELKKQKLDSEAAGQPFRDTNTYRQTERVREVAMKRFSDLAEDMVACWRLIERCKATLHAPLDNGTKLVAAGTVGDVHITFEETESELLQLAGVCESVEIYPDLEPGKAVFRRSQLLDAVLYREDQPPLFMLLSEQEQLLAGNAFMRYLAQKMNPENPVLGQRQVIHLIDAGVNISNHFDMDLSSLLPTINRVPPASASSARHQVLVGD